MFTTVLGAVAVEFTAIFCAINGRFLSLNLCLKVAAVIIPPEVIHRLVGVILVLLKVLRESVCSQLIDNTWINC